MKRAATIGFLLIFFLCMTCASAFSETLEERLNRLEKEIQGLKTQAAQREAELAEIKAAAKAAPLAVASPAKPVEGDVWTKYNMRLYGRVKVDVNYDTAQFEKYNDFIGAVKAGSSYTNDSTNFNPRDTRFGFESSHTDGDWTGLGRFEVDFYGTNSVNNLIPRMRLAYVKMVYNPCDTSILVGQDWIPVAQLNPNTVDFGILTAAGNLWWRVPQITVRKQIGDFEVLASAMKHRRIETTEEGRMPWVLGRIAYNGDFLGKGNSIALGGGYQTESVYKTTTSADGHRIERYLLAAEFKLARGPWSLRAEPWIGQGIGDEFLRYDLGVNSHASDAADPEAIWAIGGFVDLTYKVDPRLSFTVGYGVDDPRDEDLAGINFNDSNAARDRQFTMNSQLFFNTWYQLTKAIKVGAELIHLKTERLSDTNSGNRFTVSTWYEF
ncbi:MAG: hypothetical protein RDU59_05640 [Thermodesulfobacteriota bacterium]|nr:hypothetical protein [Thermodesulfobacteriota bacterium]